MLIVVGWFWFFFVGIDMVLELIELREGGRVGFAGRRYEDVIGGVVEDSRE